MPTPDTHTYELRPFAVAEAEMVAGWASGPEDVWHAAGVLQFPLTAADVARWTMETTYAFTLRVDGDLAAYAEILEDDVDGDVEIQHLLVAPDKRGAGVGRALLGRLCAFLRAKNTYPAVWLRVGRDNGAGLRCALAAGFRPHDSLSGPQGVWLQNPLISH